MLRTNLNALGDSVVSFAVLALAASPDHGSQLGFLIGYQNPSGFPRNRVLRGSSGWDVAYGASVMWLPSKTLDCAVNVFFFLPGELGFKVRML